MLNKHCPIAPFSQRVWLKQPGTSLPLLSYPKEAHLVLGCFLFPGKRPQSSLALTEQGSGESGQREATALRSLETELGLE